MFRLLWRCITDPAYVERLEREVNELRVKDYKHAKLLESYKGTFDRIKALNEELKDALDG